MSDYTNKNVIITGAGSGIGKAMAVLFADAGAQVIIAERNEDAALSSRNLSW